MNYKYLLITSAFNEETNIEKTIQSVLSQTICPILWIIISDGSTDKTDEIVLKYASEYGFIEFIKIHADEKKHNFGSKVRAINKGIQTINNEIQYDFIGILDADLSFDTDYYKEILIKFHNDENLGIAGGDVIEHVDGKFKKRIKTYNSVAGGVQLYRRKCFQSLAGFQPFEYGGEDAAMEIEARMLGWEVQTFPEYQVIHHGYVGGRAGNLLKSRFRRGEMYRYIGYHPLFHVIRCFYRLFEKPYLSGTFAEISGYYYYFFRHNQIKVSEQMLKYLRKEQVERLKKILFLR